MLEVEKAGHRLAIDHGVKRVASPALITERFVKLNRRLLGLPHIEIENLVAGVARRRLDGSCQKPRQPMSAPPRRHEIAGEGRRMRLRFAVAGRARKLGRAGDHAIEPPDEEVALRYQHHAAPIGFHDVARWRLEPAETAAGLDGILGRLAKFGQVTSGELRDAFYSNLWHRQFQGFHVRKLERMRRPTRWLFSGWNCAPAMFP